MVKLDSDILGLLMAIATFLIPVLSAIFDKRRKKGGKPKEEPEILPQVEEEDEDSPFFSLKSVFEEAITELKAEVQEPVMEEEQADEIIPVMEDIPVEAEPATVVAKPSVIPPVVEEKREEIMQVAVEKGGRKGIAERVRNNPKDLVLFAEIMNPKFKEF